MPETEDHTDRNFSRRTKRKHTAINYYKGSCEEEDEEEEFYDDELGHLNIDTSTQEYLFNLANRQAHDEFEGHPDPHVDRDLLAQPQENPYEGGEGGELPKTVDKWGGCELVAEKDGTFALYTEERERLLRSILSDRIEELFVMEERDGFITANSIRKDRWVVAKVLPRARYLYKLNS